jgi:hypothetical protein
VEANAIAPRSIELAKELTLVKIYGIGTVSLATNTTTTVESDFSWGSYTISLTTYCITIPAPIVSEAEMLIISTAESEFFNQIRNESTTATSFNHMSCRFSHQQLALRNFLTLSNISRLQADMLLPTRFMMSLKEIATVTE